MVVQLDKYYLAFMEPKIHYLVERSLLLDPMLSHLNPVHTLSRYCFKMPIILSSHLRLGILIGLFI
jgi:hypothetical protein